jgi:hypothetical protein
MTAEITLVLIFGMVAGGALGYATAWRQARKLEFHGVELAAWDQHFDLGAGPKENTHEMPRRSIPRAS